VFHAILCLLPVATLAIPLLARRYPGERVLLALRRVDPRVWPRPRSSAMPRRGVVRSAVRGGRLMGFALAVRPPPRPLAAS